MVGAISMVADTGTCPCLYLYTRTSCRLRIKNNGKIWSYKSLAGMKRLKLVKSNGQKSILSLHKANGTSRKHLSFHNFRVANELGGQYEEIFNDVKLQIRDSFTAKAVRTVLYQLYEMNPPTYTWFHNFVAANDPVDGKLFLRKLVKERQELAERVMVTRLHLYSKWIKVCDHAEMYKDLSDENLELMRERLMETIVWPSDDSNSTDKTS